MLRFPNVTCTFKKKTKKNQTFSSDFTVYMRESKITSALYQIELVDFGTNYLIRLVIA